MKPLIRRYAIRHLTKIIFATAAFWMAIGLFFLAHDGTAKDKGKDARRRDGHARTEPIDSKKSEWRFVPNGFTPKTQFKMAEKVEREVPNLPAVFLFKRLNLKYRFNKTCASMPSLFEIRFNQVYWQHTKFVQSDINVYLYAAYYDNRILVPVTTNSGAPTTNVRLLVMIDTFYNATPPSCFCQFWYKNSKIPAFSAQASVNLVWRPEWGYKPGHMLIPTLISCPVPSHSEIPHVVSLVETPCENAQNAVRVQHSLVHERDVTNQKHFAVCVKGLTFYNEDRSVRLIEWLELLRKVGADKVFLYELAVTKRMRQVLRHYVASGFVDLTQLTLAGDQTSNPDLMTLYVEYEVVRKRQNELIPYNDCLYRNLYKYRFVVLMDIDEAIVPVKPQHFTWTEMLKDALEQTIISLRPQNQIFRNESGHLGKMAAFEIKAPADIHSWENSHYSSLCTRNIYFFDNLTSEALESSYPDMHQQIPVPDYMHMLKHVVRAANYTKLNHYTKCFHSTLRVLTLHNHFPRHCVTPDCYFFNIPTTSGHLQHYRRSCTFGLENLCTTSFMKDTVVDLTLGKYKNDLIQNVRQVMHQLGFISRE